MSDLSRFFAFAGEQPRADDEQRTGHQSHTDGHHSAAAVSSPTVRHQSAAADSRTMLIHTTSLQLWALRNQELKQLCKFCGFRVSGRKDELVSRLSTEWSTAPHGTFNTARLLTLAAKARHTKRPIDFAEYQVRASSPAILRVSKWQAMQQNHTSAVQTSWCFCGKQLFGTASVRCSACKQLRHLQCMQTKDYKPGEICPLCKLADLQPFLKCEQNLIRPILMTSFGIPKHRAHSGKWEKEYIFQISEQQHWTHQVLLSCASLVHDPAQPSWPRALRVQINGVDTRDYLRTPYTIVDRLVVPGKNVVRFEVKHVDCYFQDPTTLLFSIQLVRPLSIQDMIETIRTYRSRSYEMGKNRIIQTISADEFSVGSHNRVSLACPLSLGPIQVPGRGANCKHLRCFDLHTFLKYNYKSSRSNAFKCPLCNKVARCRDLYLDGYFERIIDEMDISKYEDGDFYCDVFPDGHWTPLVKGARLKRSASATLVVDLDHSATATSAPIFNSIASNRTAASMSSSDSVYSSSSSFTLGVPDIDDDPAAVDCASTIADLFSDDVTSLFADMPGGDSLEDAISLIDD